jgi:GcrA cell cycle regulator
MEVTTRRHVAPRQKSGSQSAWTDATVARLHELWANGRTAAQIAHEIGMSRSAVLGKASRLGLRRRRAARVLHPMSAVRRGATSRADLVVEKLLAERVRALALLEAQLRREPVAPEVPSPESRPCSFIALTRDTCRWPVGDVGEADFHFCGAPPDGDHVYCAHHRHIARPREAGGDAHADSASCVASKLAISNR